MKIKFIITNETDYVISQEIKSEYSVEKNGLEFFQKLNEYINKYIFEYNKINESKIKKLEVFDENEIKITEFVKND